jgi:phosphate transport system ATP-binding protein
MSTYPPPSTPPPPLAEKMLAKDLGASFPDTVALKGITMPVVEHRVTAVIGPSGCGKSTFIRCLNRMHEVVPGATTSGDVLLDGKTIYGSAVDPVGIRRKVGMVFQKPNPFPEMSVRDNVLAGLRLNGIRAQSPDAVVEAALTQAAMWDEMKDSLDKPGGSLSGGQQQRLCIARCLALEPEVILMDEPCSSLDPDRDGAHRGAHSRPPRALHDRHRDALDAAGRARLRFHRVLLPGGARRVRPRRRHLHAPRGPPHRGVHHRSLRLNQRS